MSEQKKIFEEREAKTYSGAGMLFFTLLIILLSIAGFVFGIIGIVNSSAVIGTILVILCSIVFTASMIMLSGFKIIKPNEALVLTLFGKYTGSIKQDGFFWVNPFSSAVNPAFEKNTGIVNNFMNAAAAKNGNSENTENMSASYSKKISLKAMTLRNEKQKINDELGNPIEIGINVFWQIENTAKAVFNVDNYEEYLSTQADSALRNVVRLYPYDTNDDGNSDESQISLRGSSKEIADVLEQELQEKVDIAGIKILEVKITHLAYAPEIASAMLQRQQAVAVIAARKKIVEGAVGMVQMALDELSENNVCDLDEERKAQMVSNLLVVLCGNKDAQPIVNSGSIY